MPIKKRLTITALFVKVKLIERSGIFLEKTLKKLAKVIDRMMDHVALFGGPSVVSNDDLDHYLDPVFYLIFVQNKRRIKEC